MQNQFFKILVVGTVRNVSEGLRNEISRLEGVFLNLGEPSFFLVESDSTDATVKILEHLSNSKRNFNYITFGELRDKIPDRVERIRFCRNAYVNFIRDSILVEEWSYIVVADLDGMNPKISAESIERTLKSMQSWDALFANQKFGYYDIFALRCVGWVESDLLRELETKREVETVGISSIAIITYIKNQIRRQKVLYSQMKRIPQGAEIIPVESAFGGLGIYKPKLFLNCDYSLSPGELPDGSEHITFHRKCTAKRFSLGIDPQLVNSHFNPYNINKFFVIRMVRDLKRLTKNRLGEFKDTKYIRGV